MVGAAIHHGLNLNLMPASEDQLMLFAMELSQSRTVSTIRYYIPAASGRAIKPRPRLDHPERDSEEVPSLDKYEAPCHPQGTLAKSPGMESKII